MDTRSLVIHTYLLLSTALLAQMLLCQIEGFNSAILDYQVWAGLQGVEQELNTCNSKIAVSRVPVPVPENFKLEYGGRE